MLADLVVEGSESTWKLDVEVVPAAAGSASRPAGPSLGSFAERLAAASPALSPAVVALRVLYSLEAAVDRLVRAAGIDGPCVVRAGGIGGTSASLHVIGSDPGADRWLAGASGSQRLTIAHGLRRSAGPGVDLDDVVAAVQHLMDVVDGDGPFDVSVVVAERRAGIIVELSGPAEQAAA